jgi:hypothetical protein
VYAEATYGVPVTEPALARMRSYEEENITSPSRSIVVKADSPHVQ